MASSASYNKNRNRRGLCRDCANPVANNVLCLACRNKLNDRRKQQRFDRLVDREDRLVNRLHLLNYKLAAEVLGVKLLTIRDYVTDGLLAINRYERGQAWVLREDVARIGQLRQPRPIGRGRYWKGKVNARKG